MNLFRLNKNNEFIYTLSKIKEKIPSAIIAGGALRDLYHNKQVNDIDIFVPQETPGIKDDLVYSESFWEKRFNLHNGYRESFDYIERLAEDEDDTYEVNNNIGGVFEVRKNNLMYNIIVTEVPPTEYVLRYFDLGLCKIYCDGNKIHLSADFMYDSEFNKMTVVSEDMPQEEFNHMMNYHIKKLKTKYPEFTLDIPHKYDNLLSEYNKHYT